MSGYVQSLPFLQHVLSIFFVSYHSEVLAQRCSTPLRLSKHSRWHDGALELQKGVMQGDANICSTLDIGCLCRPLMLRARGAPAEGCVLTSSFVNDVFISLECSISS